MFRSALWRLILVDIAVATAAVLVLVVVAFLLIRSNLERSAFRTLEDVAETVAMSDLHELFEDDEDENSFSRTASIGSTSYWIIGLDGHIYASSTPGRALVQPHSVSSAVVAGGEIEKTVIGADSGDVRVVTLPRLGESPAYLVQVSAPDTVGRDLNSIVVSLVITGLVGVVFAAGAGSYVARRTLAPVEHAFELQRDFISGASHELRTPVAVIQANADAIQRLVPSLGAEDAKILEDLQIESAFLGQLIGRLAELSRLQGEEALALEQVDVGQLNVELVRSMELLVAGAGMTITTVGSDVEVLAKADRVMLRQVVQSLIDNSLKYAGPGASIELTVRTVGNRCDLVVSDDGDGISAEHLPFVTDRFYRADKARSRRTGGSGLGLAIAREAVLSMGGELTVSSSEETGTRVTIGLDIA